MFAAAENNILDGFLDSARQLELALNGLREEQLDLRAAPGEWSIRQIVHHLADDADVWSFILKRAIVQPGAEVIFGEFAGNEAWAAGLEFHRRSIRAAMALIQAHHVYLAEVVDHFPQARERAVMVRFNQAMDPQPINVGQIVEMLADHMRMHVETIRAIREANGL